MRVLAISTSSWNSNNREFYRRLSLNGINLKLIVPESWDFGKGAKPADIIANEDPDIAFLTPSNYHQRLYYLKGIKKVVNEFRPDVIYYEGDPGSIMSVYLGFMARRSHSKFIALSCENLSQRPFDVIKREGIGQLHNSLLKYLLIRLSRSKIDDLLVINNDGLKCFKRIGFKKVTKIPLGFNESIFKLNLDARKRVRSRLNISKDTIVISYFGRLVFEKGVHILIDTLNNLNVDNWVFLIDEFSGYKNDYQNVIEEKILKSKIKTKTIFFKANHTEIADYMNATDISVLASIPTNKWVEQYGRVVPEAMACGNRVIVSDIGAQNEFFSKDYFYKFNHNNHLSKLQTLIEKSCFDYNNGLLDRESISLYSQENFGINKQLNIFLKIIKNEK